MDLNDLRTYLKLGNFPTQLEFENNIEEEKVSVYKDINQKRLAVKKYDVAYLNKNAVRCYNEVNILKKLGDFHGVIYLIDSFMAVNNDVYLLLPYYPNGDLLKVLDEQKSLHDDQIRNVINQMLCILAHLRSMKIIHRDIKMENIIAADSQFLFSIKLIDFECSVIYDPKCPPVDNVGTHPYKAPEVEKNKPQDFKADIWSLGAVIYSLKTCEQFDRKLLTKNNVIRSDRYLLSLLKGMLVKNPKKRFDIDKCTEHKWVTERYSETSGNFIIRKVFKLFGKVNLKN